jgi:hypothetical protein
MTINTTIYYVSSDELHIYILWPLCTHLQANEVHKGKNYNCKFIFVWLIWDVNLWVFNIHVNMKCKNQLKYMINYLISNFLKGNYKLHPFKAHIILPLNYLHILIGFNILYWHVYCNTKRMKSRSNHAKISLQF